MNTNKQTGEETMNESYKDKFNATMKQFGIDSLDDLKSDAEKKKFFKAVDKSHKAANEEVQLTEKKAKFLSLQMQNEKEPKRLERWLYKNMSQVNTPYDGPYISDLNVEFEDVDNADDLMKKIKRAGFRFKVDQREESVTEELISIAEETISEMMSTEMMAAMKQMPEMMKKMEMLKAETDPTKVEMMKQEMMMKAMKQMPEMSEMMKKEMMKQMDEYGSMNAMKEELTPAQKKLPAGLQKAIAAKGKKKEETKDAEEMEEEMKDLEPNAEMLKAMVKDPHKSKEGDPKDDILAQYDDTQVKADVAKKGGADMSKVQDAPKMMTAMKKISAMYKTEKYHESKPGSLNDVLAQMHLNEQKSVSIKVKEFSSLVETYLAKGGVLGNLTAGIQEVELNKTLKLGEAREFITTYNNHFLTNYRAEEFIKEDELSEAMMGNYKIENDPMAGEFGFVSKKAMDDNAKTVGGNKGVMAMVKRGMNPDMIAKKYGMYPAAVKKMAKGQTL